MSGVVNEMPLWERELRKWAGALCDEREVRWRVNIIRGLIEQDLLRPVEDEPVEHDLRPAECCWAYVVTSGRGYHHTFDSVWLDEDAARGYANTLKDGQIAYRLPLKGVTGAEREPDWTPFDGAKPAFTNDDADMLLARLDAAEAEIKALRAESQRLHGRMDGVISRIVRLFASAADGLEVKR